MPHFRLIFEGHIKPQCSRNQVERRLSHLYQVPIEEIAGLFSRPPVILKEGLDYETAMKDKTDFEATGALCRLEAQPAPPRTGEPSAFANHPGEAAGRRYGLRHPYALAFFSRAFYRDVAAHWRGLAFVHLLLVLGLSAAAYTVHFRTLIGMFVAQEAPGIVAQIPVIDIVDGRVQVAVEEPYLIRHPDSGTVLAVIDTTGETATLAETDAVLLLTADRLAARLSDTESRILDLRGIASLRIDREVVTAWLMDLQRWTPFILFPLVLGVFYIMRCAQVLLFGGIGLVLAGRHAPPLPYGAAVSVAVMALTPFLLIDALLLMAGIHLPFWRLGGLLLVLAYLVFGIRSAVRAA